MARRHSDQVLEKIPIMPGVTFIPYGDGSPEDTLRALMEEIENSHAKEEQKAGKGRQK
jgi:hypothetical protein